MAIIKEVTIEDNSDLVRKALPDQLKMALTAIGMAGETNAKAHITDVVYNTPQSPSYKRTGRLRNSLTYQVDENDLAVFIGSNVEYAIYIELGSSRMRPRPYLRPAITNHTDEYKRLAMEALNT